MPHEVTVSHSRSQRGSVSAAAAASSMVHDPLGDPHEAQEEYKIKITPLDKLTGLDAIIVAVAHNEYIKNVDGIFARVRDGGVVIDVKSSITAKPPRGIRLWSL